MTYFLYFTFGPIQGFISQARKTSDLFAGSQILSELAFIALKEAESKVGDENILFPTLNSPSYPNRLLIRTDVADVSELRKIGKAICKAVQLHWKLLAETTLTGSELKKPIGFNEQIENLLEMYWTAVPVSENQYNSAIYLKLLAAMNTRKNVRLIDGLTETGRKCSVDGERNALFYKGHAPSGLLTFNPEGEAVKIKMHDYSFAEGEALSAVSFVKRKYGKHNAQAFPSTAKIALMPILYDLVGHELLERYKSEFPDFDEQLLYADNLTENYLVRYAHKVFLKPTSASEVIPHLKKSLEKVYACKPESTWSTYYALLLFDGDSMGKWFSGEYLEPNSDLIKFQKFFSEKLGDYGRWANTYLAAPKGQVVYAGGDDFMGFINLNYLYEVMQTLRDKFDSFIADPLSKALLTENSFQLKPAIRFTFSAGVVVAHYKTPLRDVLDIARRMEGKAKKYPQKNAYAVAIKLRSGSEEFVIFPWFSQGIATTKQLQTITNAFADYTLSDSFFRRWEAEQRPIDQENKELLISLLYYSLARSLQPGADIEPIKQAVAMLENSLHKKNDSEEINFVNAFLRIAEFIARQIRTRSQPLLTNVSE